MNYKQLKTLYKKEIMDVLRDKKTILTMVVLPVILYPLLFVIIMQVITMISTSQQEQTYYIAYDQVAEEDKVALNDWMAGEEDALTYNIEEKKSKDPKKDLEDEIIDAYLTTKVTGQQITYEIHYLSAVTNSMNASDMLKEEIESYRKHVAEKNAETAGLDVQKVLYPVNSELIDRSSSESSIGSILGSIIPFLMITSILMGAMYPAIDATAGEKERGTLETLLTLPIGNMELIMSKFFSVATIAVVSVLINVLSMSGIAAYLYATISSLAEETGAFHLGSFVPATLISLVCIIAFALFMSALVMCVCAFAKSFKEANNYVTPVTLVVMLTAYIGFIPNVELTAKTALVPVANICLLMKALLVFKYDFSMIIMVLLSNVFYAFVAIWVLGKIYNSESILFGESASGIKLFERRKNIKKGSLPSIAESLFIVVVALLIMVYLGGMIGMKHPIMGVVIPQLIMALLAVLACVYIKGNPKVVFRMNRPRFKHIIGAICMFIGTCGLSMFVGNILSYFMKEDSQALNEMYAGILENVPFWGALLVIALTPAVCEELLYRGYMFTAFRQKMNIGKSILIVSFIFGLSHMSLIKLLPTMILGIALAYTIEQTDSIFASSLIHFLNNALAVGVMYYGEKIVILQNEASDTKLMIGFVVCAIVFLPVAIVLLRNKSDEKVLDIK